MPNRLPRNQQRTLQKELRRRDEPDWVAEPGSEHEKQLLRGWARHKPPDDPERKEILRWIEKPSENRNELFWNSAKHSVLGRVAHDNALKRHKQLTDDRLWLVACFTARGLTQPEIAKLLGVHDRTIDIAVSALKQLISEECLCDLSSINSVRIAEWFLGL